MRQSQLNHFLVRAAVAVGVLGTALAAPLQASAQTASSATAAPAAAKPAAPATTPSVPTIDRIKQTRVINVGHRESAVPFSYLSPDKKPIGFSIDLCTRVVDGIRRDLKMSELKINWIMVQSAERLPFVKDGKIDLECGNTTVTAERRKQVEFTVPIFIAGSGVLVRNDDNAKELKDLRKRKVAVIAGTTGEKIINRGNEMLMQLDVVRVKANGDAMAALESKQADAWITDDILLSAFRAQHKTPANFRLLEKRHTVEPLALMYRKDDGEFGKMVDREVIETINKGEIQKMYAKWFTSAIPPNNQSLDVPIGRLLKEAWRTPTKLQADVDVILF